MSYLTRLWDKIVLKLGVIAGFIKPLANELKIAVSEGDAAKARAINAKLREKAMDVIALCDKVDLVLEDNTVTIAEGSEVALAIEAIAD
jgi:hypothetical protein